MTNSRFVAVAMEADLAPDTLKAVSVDGRSILLCHSDGQVYAIENLCSHADEPLACGRLRNGWIACPAHGARFDLETGGPLNPPAMAPIATFPVRIIDGQIEIGI